MERTWWESRQNRGMARPSAGTFLVLLILITISLSGNAAPASKSEVDAPVISDFTISPSELKTGEPLTYYFTIVSTKAPVESVVMEWIRTSPKYWSTGPTEIKDPQRFIKGNKFTFTRKEGIPIGIGYRGGICEYAVNVYIVDKQGRKSNALSTTVKQK